MKEYRIKDIAIQIGSGTTPSSNNEKYYTPGVHHWINTGDLNNENVTCGKKLISDLALQEVPSLRFYPIDTVLIAMYGASIGKTGLLKVKATVNQACCALVPNTKLVSPQYLLYFMTDYKTNLIKESFGGTQPNVSQAIIANTIIKVPSLEVQNYIVSYLDAKTSAIDKRISTLEKKLDAYKRLKRSIINEAVTRGLNPKVALKDSGIEWIGMIPEHWEVKRMKDYISLTKGRTPAELTMECTGLPYLNMDYLRSREGKVTFYPEQTEGLFAIDENEILVLWDGANAGEFILSKKGYLGSTMALLKVCDQQIDKRYLYALLKGIESTSKYFANGTTIPHFDSNVLMGYCYPLPPLSEQSAIADYLDDKCTKIDAAITNISKQIDALKRLKRALIDEVLTGKRSV